MKKALLNLTEDSSIVKHRDLTSFLKKNSFPILHASSNQEQENDYFSYLEKSGFIDRSASLSQGKVYRFDNPVILHSLVVLTNRCNMDCTYCYTEANDHLNEEEINGEKWKHIFDNIKIPRSERIQNLSFTGGEPTCHPDFLDIFNHVSGRYKVEVSTNGLRLTDRDLEAFGNFDGLIGINISIDSCYSQEDEIMRGKDTYEKRVANLRRLCERSIPTCLGMVVNGITVNSLKDTTRFFLDQFPGLKIKYIPISCMGKALSLENSLFLSENDAEKYVRDVSKMIKEYGERILTDPTSSLENNISENFHWSGRCSHMKYDSEKSLYKTRMINNKLSGPEKCNAAYGVVSISPSGNLRPCLRADSFYEEILDENIRERIMPSLIGLSFEEIGKLPFWTDVKKSSCGFNPLNTCALKYNLGGKNGSK
ncbi:MAG: radical SAM protein [Nanoarchaeota archaeon]|nr:radical SAM protein [Nanoarchaeota archaeon]